MADAKWTARTTLFDRPGGRPTASCHAVVVDEGGNTVATVYGNHCGGEEALRRARLTAAAPALLKACQAANHAVCSLIACREGITNDLLVEVKTAISNATARATDGATHP